MKNKRLLLLPLALSSGLIANASAAVILDGNGAFPTAETAAVYTTILQNEERDARSNRNLAQSFQVTDGFQLDAIYIRYQAPNGGYGDGTLNLRIFAVNDVHASSATRAPGTEDLLNVQITLDAAARAAADFTTSNSSSSTLVFDLTGTDEIWLPATTGTAGYVMMFQDNNAPTALFTWQSYGEVYDGGRSYGNGSDFTFAVTAIPEPSSAALGLLGGLGLLRRRR